MITIFQPVSIIKNKEVECLFCFLQPCHAQRHELNMSLNYNSWYQLYESTHKLSSFSQLLTAHNCKNEKEYSWHVPAMKFIGWSSWSKSCKYTIKIMIYVNMWNFGQFRENFIFCQWLLNWSSNRKILLHMCDTYNCDYLQHSTFSFS